MTTLKVGDKAPAFSLPDAEGRTVSLEDFSGRRVILYFYPKDNTSGCTLEAKNLRDGKAELLRLGFEVVGISPDSVCSHNGFSCKNALNFTLLSDADKSVAEAYGVWGEKKLYGRTYMGIFRTTFVIDAQGIIEKIFTKVNVAAHWQQIVDSYTEIK